MEQERQSIAVEIPVVEGCFSEEAQRLLQPKSGSRLEGWGESLLEVTKTVLCRNATGTIS